ncbi:protein FAM98A-like [Apostichopus japonicus]|uniref:protein FAM98A-like n=1 Tax=Stichopus japonicus TaxID=307972 RepID=UPI003AB89756
MENDILDSLEDLGYQGELLEETSFREAVKGGPCSPLFTSLVSWLAENLCKLENVEASVSSTSSAEEADTFELELCGLLSELQCPHESLTQGETINRFGNEKNRLLLLDFLTTELQAARITALKEETENKMETDEDSHWDLSSKYLRQICRALQLSKPPPNITAEMLFTKLESQARAAVSKSKHGVGTPLLKSNLSEQQWAKLAKINERMRNEYTLRRKMLLKRLDVTVQSFRWSDRAKGKEDTLASTFQPKRKALKADSGITLASLMAARDDLAKLKKTSSGVARESAKCPINKVLIGSVPDRGGRPTEATPPPPEMPSFMKRTEGSRGGGRGRGRGRGGRVQGGWSNQGDKSRGSWSQDRGNSQGGFQDRGGYQADGYQGGGGGGGGGGIYQGGGGVDYQRGGHNGGYRGGGGHQRGGRRGRRY